MVSATVAKRASGRRDCAVQSKRRPVLELPRVLSRGSERPPRRGLSGDRGKCARAPRRVLTCLLVRGWQLIPGGSSVAA
jgi:hypothetical protein